MDDQTHLEYKDRINLGSYYTKPEIVDIVYAILSKHTCDFVRYCLLDTSCGYGSFFNNDLPFRKKIGADIDEEAVQKARKHNAKASFIKKNGLANIGRDRYGISEKEKLVIVGNPPYNDTTSIIRKNIKRELEEIDPDVKARDLGISFLLSYAKLNPDFICVLHPLSYLIKKANFSLLKPFCNKYELCDSVVISSGEFSETSKTTSFPIIIALYRRSERGMDFDFIRNNPFRTKNGKTFRLSEFDSISNYLSKYPNQKSVSPENAVAKFWTMRDINALKRSKTFVDKTSYNTVFVTRNKLEYYCYVDVFKKYIKHIPYYLGNCDVMIDNKRFAEIKDCFVQSSKRDNPELLPECRFNMDAKTCNSKIESYFKILLGEHYVY